MATLSNTKFDLGKPSKPSGRWQTRLQYSLDIRNLLNHLGDGKPRHQSAIDVCLLNHLGDGKHYRQRLV